MSDNSTEGAHLFDSEKPLRADIVDAVKKAANRVFMTEIEHKEARLQYEQTYRRDRDARLALGILLSEGVVSRLPPPGPIKDPRS